MKSQIKSYGLVLLFFIILAAISFRCAWGPDQVFSGSDCNIGSVSAGHNYAPESFTGAFCAGPFLGYAFKMPYSFFSVGRWLLPPKVFCDIWYSVCLVLGSVALVAYLRQWKLGWLSCIVGSVSAFWMGSITLSAAGHLNKLGVMALFSVALFLLERSLRAVSHKGRLGFSTGTGLCVGLMLLEQQDVALFAGIFLGIYSLGRLINTAQKKWWVWVELLLPIILLGGAIAAPTVLQVYDRNVTQVGISEDASKNWEFVTQWSFVPEEWCDLIAPGYMGWSSGNPEGPYWGKVGRSDGWELTHQGFQNFRLDSIYIGFVPLLLAAYACVAWRRRREERFAIWLWGGLALLALFLAGGKYSPVYRLFYELPFVGNIRAPIKFMHNFQVMIGILCAFGADALFKQTGKRCDVLCRGAAGVAGLCLFLGLLVPLRQGEFVQWGQYADVIISTMRFAWLKTAGVVGVLALAMFLVRKFPLKKNLWVGMLIAGLVLDSVMLSVHYFKAENIKTLNQGGVLFDALKKLQGNARVAFSDVSGIYNRLLAVEAPYYDLNMFNAWQMPRMTQDYKKWFEAAGKNRQRVWQLASVKYITAPAAVYTEMPVSVKKRFEPQLFYRFVPDAGGVGVQKIDNPSHIDDQVLLQFDDALPRFSLFSDWEILPLEDHLDRLFDPQFFPRKTVLVEPGKLDVSTPGCPAVIEVPGGDCYRNKAVLAVNSHKPSILLFTQRYEPQWRVYMDGEPALLLRCNYLNMGVFVPRGEHAVEFCVD